LEVGAVVTGGAGPNSSVEPTATTTTTMEKATATATTTTAAN